MCLSPASQEQLFLPWILQFTVFVAFNFTLTFCLFLNKLSWLNNSFYHELSGLFSGHDCHFVLLAGLSQWRIATLHRKNECGKTLSGLTLEWVPVCQLLRSLWPFFVLHFISLFHCAEQDSFCFNMSDAQTCCCKLSRHSSLKDHGSTVWSKSDKQLNWSTVACLHLFSQAFERSEPIIDLWPSSKHVA